MKNLSSLLLTALCIIISLPVFAQTVSNFENFNLRPGEYINDAGPEGRFKSGSVDLPNFYDPDFNFWSGWSVTADTNTTTPGFTNQYSSIAGEGALGTRAYAIGYAYDPVMIRLTGNALGKRVIGMYVSNSTYAYLSMRDGDSFAKKFGGETGTDPDWYKLTIRKHFGGAVSDDSIDVYLADFRFDEPSKDYIRDEWMYVDMSVLGEADSFQVVLSSSDVGVFGMNTPAYVCVDQIITDNLLASSGVSADGSQLMVFPNPVQDVLYFEMPVKGLASVFSLDGKRMWSAELTKGTHEVEVSSWPRGLYFLHAQGFNPTKVVLE